MPVVNTPDGPIETNLPPEAVKDIEVKAEPTPEVKPEPVKVEPTPPAPAPAPTEKPADPVKPADPPAPEAPKGKAKPIANLLSKLNEERTAREALEKELSELKAKPAAPTTEAADEITALAQKHGVTDPSLIKDIIETARKGLSSSNPAIPKEVQDLLAERQAEKAQEAEIAAFNTRAEKLATVFKDEPIAAHKDKLLELAYSTEKAPDGERYCDKELSEIYFAFIKPAVEPGKPSAESSRGGSQTGTKVVDYEEVMNDAAAIESMSSEEFQKFSTWLNEKQGDVPIKKSR